MAQQNTDLSRIASPTDYDAESPSGEVTVINDVDVTQKLLSALNDASCQDILRGISDEPLSANEISEERQLPVSTTYRKLDHLTDVGLVTEQTCIRPSGKNSNRYSQADVNILISYNSRGEMILRTDRNRQ